MTDRYGLMGAALGQGRLKVKIDAIFKLSEMGYGDELIRKIFRIDTAEAYRAKKEIEDVYRVGFADPDEYFKKMCSILDAYRESTLW